MSPHSPSRRALAALAILTVVAFATRWIGLGALLPCAREADTVIVHVAASYDRPAGAPLSDAAYPSTSYPFLLPAILIACPGSNFPTAAPLEAPRAEHLAAAAEPYLRARRLVALLSLLAVPATYLLARRFLEPSWALCAAALVVTSDLALGLSQQARPHAALLGTNTVALVAVVALVRRASLGAYAAAGGACALALATLHSGAFVLPALGLAHLLGWRRDRDRARWRRLVLACGICALAFVAAYPFLVFGDPLQRDDPTRLDLGQHSIRWESWNGRGFAAMWPGLFARDPVVAVGAVAGVALLLVASIASLARRRSRDANDTRSAEAWVVATHTLVHLGLFGLQEQFYTRFLVPVLPAACLVLAWGAREATEFVVHRAGLARAPRWRLGLVAVVVAAVLVAPAWRTVESVVERARTDTTTLAARWIEAHVPPEAGPIGLDVSLDLPLWQAREGLAERFAWSLRPWQRYQLENPRLDAAGPRYDVRQLFDPGMMRERRIRAEAVAERIETLGITWAVVTLPQGEHADRDETREGVRRVAGEPVARFLPDRLDVARASVVQAAEPSADDTAVERERVRERLGPAIEIYQIPR